MDPISVTSPVRTASLAGFAAHVRKHHLDEAAAANLAKARELAVPLLGAFARLSEAELLKQTRDGLGLFLQGLEDGTAEANAAASLEAWQRDELPGVSKDGVSPSDLVLVYAAQKQTLLGLLPLYCADAASAVTVMQQLESFYTRVQDAAFGVFTRMHDESVRLQAENETTNAFNEELQASNEELASQAEELMSQQEELRSLAAALEQANSHLKAHAESVEAEVARRTAELRSSESRFRIMFEQAALGVATMSLAGDILEANPALHAMLGYEPGELNGRDVMVLNPPHEMDASRDRLAAMASHTGAPLQAEKQYVRKDGSLMWAHMTASVVCDESGEPAFSIAMVKDITGRKAAEAELIERTAQLEAANAQLKEADRYKDEFLSVISHELRTPLNFIVSFASVLEDELAGALNPEQHGYVGKILYGADRMLLLVNNLLDMSRMRAGRFELALAPTCFQELAAEVLTSLRPLAEQAGLALEMDVAAVTDEVRVDGHRVVQVLSNLVDNAIKFTPAGGSVLVRASVQDGWLHASVVDTGQGIADDQRKKLFLPFSQLDMSRTRQSGGTGLGLSICKGLVEAHGGEIGVDSEVGVGSTFWFKVPV